MPKARLGGFEPSTRGLYFHFTQTKSPLTYLAHPSKHRGLRGKGRFNINHNVNLVSQFTRRPDPAHRVWAAVMKGAKPFIPRHVY